MRGIILNYNRMGFTLFHEIGHNLGIPHLPLPHNFMKAQLENTDDPEAATHATDMQRQSLERGSSNLPYSLKKLTD